MPMLVVEKYVDVKTPGTIDGVIVYRSYDEDSEDWGNSYKSHITPFASVFLARAYVNSFQIGEKE